MPDVNAGLGDWCVLARARARTGAMAQPHRARDSRHTAHARRRTRTEPAPRARSPPPAHACTHCDRAKVSSALVSPIVPPSCRYMTVCRVRVCHGACVRVPSRAQEVRSVRQPQLRPPHPVQPLPRRAAKRLRSKWSPNAPAMPVYYYALPAGPCQRVWAHLTRSHPPRPPRACTCARSISAANVTSCGGD